MVELAAHSGNQSTNSHLHAICSSNSSGCSGLEGWPRSSAERFPFDEAKGLACPSCSPRWAAGHPYASSLLCAVLSKDLGLLHLEVLKGFCGQFMAMTILVRVPPHLLAHEILLKNSWQN